MILAATRPVSGAVDGAQPASGSVVQGGSTSASVVLTASLGCVTALASDATIVVTIGGLAESCGIGPRTVVMAVQTTELTPIGTHVITIQEVNTVTLEVDSHVWPLEVLAQETTTTTSATTRTSSTTSTTTTNGTTTSLTVPPSTTATTGPGTTRATATTDGSGAGVVPGSTTTTSLVEARVTSATPGELEEGDPATDPRLWEEIRRALQPVLSPRVIDVLLSPLVISEVVLAALLRSGHLIMLPVAVLGALVGWALWRWLPRMRALYAERIPISFLSAKEE